MIVESQFFKLSGFFVTEKGDVIPEAVVAYEEYGTQAGPVIFITHGGLSSQHFMINALQMDPELKNGHYQIGAPKLALNLVQQVARIYFIHEGFVEELAEILNKKTGSGSVEDFRLSLGAYEVCSGRQDHRKTYFRIFVPFAPFCGNNNL